MADLLHMPAPVQLSFDLIAADDYRAEGAPPDWRERARALDVTASWIVEAPAGSGKTGLLIQRILKLLAGGDVERPEQVLAITFTKAATEEIRERVMQELERAYANTPVRGTFERETRTIADAVLGRDAAMNWHLLESPRRLNVRTIDSVCAEIARALPVTSGGSGALTPATDPGPMYREAARRTLLQLGGQDEALDEALRMLLLHRDGSVAECEALLAEMLAGRDQWGELVPLGRKQLSERWLEGTVRARLDRALELAVSRGLTELTRSLPSGFLDRLTAAAAEMANRPGHEAETSPVRICQTMHMEPEATAEHLDHWRALIHILVTPSTGTWRKALTARVLKFEISPEDKGQLTALIDEVRDRDDVLASLCRVQALPPARYPPEQWPVAKALFRVLSRALVELQIVFAERGECDFAEPALLARAALRIEHGADGYESAIGMELRHLLVDEMQDTSTNQYELIELLTRGWTSEGKTMFLVGDPKQSIYLFRQARVERFIATMKAERLGDLRMGLLQLTANFRSQAGLVESCDEGFSRVFQANEEGGPEVPFVAAQAVRPAAANRAGEGGLAWHAAVAGGTQDEARERKRLAVKQNAQDARAIVERWRSTPLPENRTEPWKLAVLVAARRDLREILAAFRGDNESPSIPVRAVDVEPLQERREVLDLLALTRALLHPADRVAWWAVLRAPWCGLGLADLHVLAGRDDHAFAETTVFDLVRSRGDQLPPESIARLERVWPVLTAAVERRSRLRVPELVERTWRSLGGDATLTETELSNAKRYLELLDELERQTGMVLLEQLTGRMRGLYASAGTEPDAVELMTIHGAKGLEWDVVIVPELERRSPAARGRLLEWEEIEGDDEDASRVVLAPIAGKGKESEALNKWLRGIRSRREAAERKRLFYVACTRAREELHLFATANRLKDGPIKPESGSLLEAAWPAASAYFEMQTATSDAESLVEDNSGLALAASAETAEDEETCTALLERLPLSFDPLARFAPRVFSGLPDAALVTSRWERPEGSFAARSLGNAVHTFLELAAQRLAKGVSLEALMTELPQWEDRIRAVLRADGLTPAIVERQAAQTMVALSRTLREPLGTWILGARADAQSEYALTAAAEQLTHVRLDRIFRAGETPGAQGTAHLWIVDYKTGSHGEKSLEAYLAAEKAKYTVQMEQYARALGTEAVRAGLWYPLLGRLIWWVIDR